MMNLHRIAPFALAALAIVACSGGGGTSSVPTNAGVAATFTLTIPPSPATASTARRAEFISSSIRSVALSYASNGGATVGPIVVNCTYQCQQTLLIQPGPVVFNVSAYDQQSAAGNLLSKGTLTSTISANIANTIVVTFNPVVASLALSLGTTTTGNAYFFAGSSGSAPLYVVAKDPSQATIIAPGTLLKTDGTPLSFSIANSDTTGHTAISPSTISATSVVSPQPYGGAAAVATLSYDGTAPHLGSPAFTITGSGLANSALTGTSVSIPPTIVAQYTIPTTGNTLYGLTTAGDGNVYAAEYNASTNAKIAKLAIANGTITETTLQFPDSQPANIGTGSDGNVYFFEGNRYRFGRLATTANGGALTEFTPVGSVGSTVAVPVGDRLLLGPDNNLWVRVTGSAYGSFPYIAKLSTSGVYTAFQLGTAAQISGSLLQNYQVYGLVNGPGSKMWVLLYYNNTYRLGSINTDGTGYSDIVIPSLNAYNQTLNYNPGDGNFYVNVSSPYYGLMQLTPAGVTTLICNQNYIGAASGILPDGSLYSGGSYLYLFRPATNTCAQIGWVSSAGLGSSYTTYADRTTLGGDQNLYQANYYSNAIIKILF